MALLHTGKVLGFGGSGNEPANLANPHPAELFDPVGGGDPVVVDQRLDSDVFCAGHCALPDGRILVAGGTRKYDWSHPISGFPPFRGSCESYTFDPVAERWRRVDDLAHGRWYPTVAMLADGRAVALAGLAKYFPWVFLRATEVFGANGTWSKLRHASRWMPLYPRLHLLPSGLLFYSGSFNTHLTFPFRLAGFPTATLDPASGAWRTIGMPADPQREEGACVLLPLAPPDYKARVLLIGGGTLQGKETTNAVERIDLSSPVPSWQPRAPMRYPRYYCYAVLLPDGNVLVCGGRVGRHGMGAMADMPPEPHHDAMPGEIPHDPNAVLTPELYDVAADTWTPLAPMSVDRLYHANALLLPDARILMAGSNPMRGMNELRIEVFEPPYLHGAPRPVIDAAPTSLAYGARFDVESSDSTSIDEAVLMRPSVTTHCVDTEQRRVGLVVQSRTAEALTLETPSNRNAAPPGYYMLFLLRAGVPSVARFLRLSSPP